jgi:hypothetical protein
LRCIKLSILLALAVNGTSIDAKPTPPFKGKSFWTYPMPPKQPPNDPLALTPSSQVPEDPEKFIWKLAAPKHAPSVTEAPVFYMDAVSRPVKVGSLPMGTIVKLEQVRAQSKIHYYAIPWKGQTGWISGVFITPAGFAASGK